MDRHWFFTWRTYGSWLPGEEGFVGEYVTPDGRRVTDNQYGSLTTERHHRLEIYSRRIQAGDTILLDASHAHVTVCQMRETAGFRGWAIDAIAVITNHVHVVFGVPGDPDPSDLLRDWKSYASRALNKRFGKPFAPRWWAEGGSKRLIADHTDRLARVQYVRDQQSPLLVWLSEEAKTLLDPTGRTPTG
jgi:REP element-mobilizing transposase RayT